MEILERPNGSRYGFASLRNIGYDLFEVNLDGEVYKYGIRDKAERVRSNRWKMHKYDRSGNLIERAIRHGRSPRYRTDKYTWPKHSPVVRVLDKATIFSICDDFIYTDISNSEIGRKYNVSDKYISRLRLGDRHSDLAREYVNSKGLAGYWQGYRH